MSTEKTLLVMAAGMGSRYGGLKQIEPVGPGGQVLTDYSLFDARRAGFERVVFVINRKIEDDFKQVIGQRIQKLMKVDYVYQSLEDIPAGFSVPEGRVKPWGTAHAIYTARTAIDGPFAVINADDYYGPDSFRLAYSALREERGDYAMVGYRLANTLTENGSVSRGICVTGENGILKEVVEHTRIEQGEDSPRYTEDGGQSWIPISGDSVASMNLFCFAHDFMDEIVARFPAFLTEKVPGNPLKAEYMLPTIVNQLLDEKKASVRVVPTSDRWYGVTYREDKPAVAQAMARLTEQGVYPASF